MSEQATVRAILQYLGARQILAWRMNVGAAVTGAEFNASPRFVRFGVKGMADIIGIMPGGRFLAIEVKSRGGRPTVYQQAWLEQVARAGGLAFVARSVQEAAARLP